MQIQRSLFMITDMCFIQREINQPYFRFIVAMTMNVSVTGDNKEFNKEFFDNENWYIRLLMEAEDRMAYSQSKISTNHGVFSNSDVTDDAEIMRGSSKDFVDDVIDREILHALIKELTERQKMVLNLVYFEEMRQQDVADYLGIKQQSVNDLLNRALKTMKKKAENEEF
jgi:RNA polymerase sigma factor (sigma-70 family)